MRRLSRVIVLVLVLAVMALLPSPTMAGPMYGQYSGTSSDGVNINPFDSNYSSILAQPGFNPAINQRPMGTTTGIASFSNQDNQGSTGSTEVSASSMSSGMASLIPAGSSASSSDENLSQITLFYSKPGIVAFTASYFLQASVQVDSPDEVGVDFTDVRIDVNGREVFFTSLTATSFATGISQTVSSNVTTGLMAFNMNPGLNTIEVISDTNGDVDSVAQLPPPPPSVPEPSSLLMVSIAGVIGLAVAYLRR
jgi:hypothetical protein